MGGESGGYMMKFAVLFVGVLLSVCCSTLASEKKLIPPHFLPAKSHGENPSEILINNNTSLANNR